MKASEALDPLLGRELGRYRLVYNLRHGGMGVVYLARHTLLGKAFAVKVLRVESADDRSMIERFKREAQALAGLTHPNTVTVTDFGTTEDGLLFLVMEFLQGVTCADLLANGGPLPPERVVHLATQVCDALHEAHQQNIIHRDIKPNNLLVTQVAGIHDVIKVIDFGLAKQTVADDGPLAEVTRAGLLIGTPQYMPPEQIKGTDMDGRGDVYSLGVTLFRLLTGRHPLEHTDVAALFHMHLSEKPPAPSEHVADGGMIDLDLDEVLLKCLEKDPADRYQDMLELKADLLQCASAGAWGTEEAKTAFEASRKYADVVDVERLLAVDVPGGAVDQDAPTQITVSPFEAQGAGLLSPMGMPIPGRTPRPGTATPSSWPKGEIVGVPHSGPHSQPIPLWSWQRVAVALVLVLLVAFIGASAAVWLARETRPATTTITSTPAPVATPTPAPVPIPVPAVAPAAPPSAGVAAIAANNVTLSVSTNPSGASVSIGERVLGSSPLTMTRPRDDGELTLSIQLVGYRKATRTIDLRVVQGDRHDLIVNLARIPPRTRKRAARAKTKTRRATGWSPKKTKRTGADRPRPAPSRSSRFKTVD